MILKRLKTALVRMLSKPGRFALFEACVIGLMSALAAVLLKEGVSWLGTWRVQASYDNHPLSFLPLISASGGLLVLWLSLGLGSLWLASTVGSSSRCNGWRPPFGQGHALDLHLL